MSKEMIISSSPQETKVAIFEDDQLVEVHIERSHEQGLVGSIYKGRVTKVLPGMQSAFVNIGLERDAFLYVSDFFEDAEEYDSIVATVEDKVEKLESTSAETGRRIPSPAVIEIPTQPEETPSLAAVRPATSDKLPPISESAITTQPTPVSAKAAETESPQEKSAAGTSSSSADGNQKTRNGFDRQSHGRYGRRRGRRRPWERRREEQQRNTQSAPPALAPSPSTTQSSSDVAPVIPVVSALTPLPGESLSKFQPAPMGSVETHPTDAPTESAAADHEPVFTESIQPEAGDVIEIPADLEPVGAVEEQVEVIAPEPAETQAEAPAEPLTAESPILPASTLETSEEVEKILSVLHESPEVVSPTTKVAETTAPPPVEVRSIAIPRVEELAHEKPAAIGPKVVAETKGEEPPATHPKEMPALAEIVTQPVEASIRPEINEASAPKAESGVSEEVIAEKPLSEASAPMETAPASPEVATMASPQAESVSDSPAPSVHEEQTIPPTTVPEGVTLAEEVAVPAQESSQPPEQVDEPLFPTYSEIPDPGAMLTARESTEGAESSASPVDEELREMLARAAKLFEFPDEVSPLSPTSEGSTAEAEKAAELAIEGHETLAVVPEIKQSKEVKAESIPVNLPTPSMPAPTAAPAPAVPVVGVSTPLPEERKRFGEPAKFERRPFQKQRFEEKRFEKKSGATGPPLVSQPEVYGPPTPYEFMTGEEKAEYNPPRRTQEKASAKIMDSSRKLTVPQPRERDFGFQRGRRGRRGRKRFGDREAREEQAEPREEKRQAPRPLITDLLREGQEILVQIAKEPLGKKGARITSHIALPGRYLVYMPTVDHIGVSRKIASDEERHRLKRILNENRSGLPGGFIVRTAGEGRSEEELKQDIRFLANTWADIRARAEKRAAPALLHRDLGVLERILRDQLSPEFTAIRIDNETEYAKVLEFVNQFQPALVSRVKLHFKDTPIFEVYGIDHEIEKALKPKVWLKSGGYVVINQTEAMVAIDVNTGKFVGKTTRLEDTIVKTNIDAAKEVARQVRLRDMGGIIVIDFIDMEERKNRQKVIQALEEAMRHDRAPSKILAFNDFGLVALTRKRVKQSLEKTLLQPCNYCQGSGMIKSIQTVCYEIQTEAKKMATQLDGREIRVRVHPEVAKALKTSEQSVINEIEAHTRKDVVIKADSQTHQDQFEIY